MEITQCAVLISGGGSGMGEATARRLHQQGAKIAILDINKESAKKVADDIQGIAYHCDVTDEESVRHALEEAEKIHGPARILVQCAGILNSRRMVNREGPMPLSEFERIIRVNLIGSFNLMRLASERMLTLEPLLDSKERGVIINTASIAAFEGQIGQIAYSASKGGIVSMTLPAARELAPFGIRVVTIAPGLVDTPLFQSLSEKARADLAESVPFPKRLAHPDEYAKLVAHVIENVMLNGEVIRLDGALRLQAK